MIKIFLERDPIEENKYVFKLFVKDNPSEMIILRALRKIAKDLNENISESNLYFIIKLLIDFYFANLNKIYNIDGLMCLHKQNNNCIINGVFNKV